NRKTSVTCLLKRCPPMQGHMDSVLGPQSYGCNGFSAPAWNKFEMKFLLNHGEQQRCFQHCKGSSHADARASPKREIGKSRNFARANRILAPAFRIKSLWIGKEPRIPLRQELEDKNVSTGGHAIAPNFAVRNGAASNAPNGGIETHRFLKNHFCVAKARNIFDLGLPIAKHLANLFN